MTPADLIEAATKLGLDTIVDALSGHGLNVPAELRERAEKALRDLLGHGVTDARRLVVEDTRPVLRPPPEPGIQSYCTTCGWQGGVGYPMIPGAACPGMNLIGRNCRVPVLRRKVGS
jgi:hypothetical protein